MNIGKSIKELRKRNNLTQVNFAKAIGVTGSYVSLIESGKKKPSLDVLEKISKALSTPLPVIFWFSVETTDIKEEKKEAYKILKHSIDRLIDSIL